MGRALSLPPQVEPASGAANNVFCASLSETTSAGTSVRFSAKLHTQDGWMRTMSYMRRSFFRSASRVDPRLG